MSTFDPDQYIGTRGMAPGSTDFPQDPRGGLPRRPSPVVAQLGLDRPVAGAQQMSPFDEINADLDRRYGQMRPAEAPPGPQAAPSGSPQAPQATTLPAGPAEAPTGLPGAPTGPDTLRPLTESSIPGASTYQTRGPGGMPIALPKGPTDFVTGMVGRAGDIAKGVGSRVADFAGLPQTAERIRGMGGEQGLRPSGVDRDSLASGAGSLATDLAVSGGVAGAAGRGVQAASGLATSAPRVQAAMDAAGRAIASFGGQGGGLGTRMAGGATAGYLTGEVIDPEHAGLAAGLGAVVPLAGATGSAVGRGFADFTRPFRASGREQIAGQVLRDAAQNPNALAGFTPRQTLGGQNVAEATQDPGLARLVHQMRADPRVGKNITAFEQLQNTQRWQPLADRFTGTNSPEMLAAARRAATDPLYAQITPQDLSTPLNTMGLRTTVKNIAATPRFRTGAVASEVMGAVTDDAAHGIQRFGTRPTQGGTNLTWRRQAPAVDVWGARQNIDQRLYGGQATEAKQTAQEASRELSKIRKSLSVQLAKIPGFKQAEQTYAAMSKPIEISEVMRDIAKAGTGGTSDAYGNPMLLAGKFTTALKNIDPEDWRKLAPSDKQFIQGLAAELQASANALAMGIGKGSPTNQLGQGQRYLSNAVGSAARNIPGGGFLADRLGTVMERNQNAIMDLIGEGVLDPSRAAALASRMPSAPVLTPSLFGQLNRGAVLAPAQLPR